MQTEKIIDHIVNWLKEYAQKAGAKGFVIGVSGGIDSAVTATLCAKTGLPLLCLDMPIHQAKNQTDRASKHVLWLQENYPNTTKTTVPLTPVFDSLVQAFPAVKNEEDRFMSLANTRARLRMTSLYYFAALHGYLVAGTGNKVEDFGVGFYTKYGDGGVDLSPIADLNKTQVFAIAQHLGVIESIQKAAPTDGLWGDHRTDEDQLGATYAELEWAMEAEQNKLSKDDFSDREKIVFERYATLHRQNKHKMIPIPVCEIPKAYL